MATLRVDEINKILRERHYYKNDLYSRAKKVSTIEHFNRLHPTDCKNIHLYKRMIKTDCSNPFSQSVFLRNRLYKSICTISFLKKPIVQIHLYNRVS